MAQYTLIKNLPLTIDMPTDVADQGWVISGSAAYHSSCNAGYIEQNFDLSAYPEWTFRYTVMSVTTGHINLEVDGILGPNRTAAGVYEETRTVTGVDELVRFYGTGINALEFVQIYPAGSGNVKGGITYAFSEDGKRWVGNRSFVPEMYCKFITDLFSFTSGTMWIHNSADVPFNNFYAVQYSSIIKYYVNINPTEIKQFFTMRQKSNKPWSVTEAYIEPTEGKSTGQRSRLKKGNFKALQGDYFACFLKNMNDPRFGNELDALMKGGDIQGNYLEITLENDDVTEVRLLSVDVEVAPHQYTY